MASWHRKTSPTASPMLKDTLRIEVRLTEQQTKYMKEAFDLFDPDETGIIDVKGIMVTLQALGLDADREEIQKIVSDSGEIDFSDFLKVMTLKMGQMDSDEKIATAFHLFDEDCTGKISFENLKRVAEELGECLTDEELQEMISFADKDRDGEVNKKEFFRMMK